MITFLYYLFLQTNQRLEVLTDPMVMVDLFLHTYKQLHNDFIGYATTNKSSFVYWNAYIS